MKRIILNILALLFFLASFAVAQPAPDRGNRRDIIQNLINRYPQVLEGPSSTFDDRRRLLLPIVAIELNKIDNNNWALLYRMDRNDSDPTPGRLTSDVLVWKPTRDHFDVFGGSGKPEDPPSKRLVATYNLIGPLPNDKDWFVRAPEEFASYATQTPIPVPDPEPEPIPIPTPNAEIESLQREIASLKEAIFQLREEGANVYKAVMERMNAIENKANTIPTQCHVPFLGCRLE